MSILQEVFENESLESEFCDSLSKARFFKYRNDANGDEKAAILLYYWNSLLSQSLYLTTQTWEITFRNKLNSFLCWKYKLNWPYNDERAMRQLKGSERKRLTEARRRQEQSRNGQASTDNIVADLSLGFWAGLLTQGYDVPFSWRYNLMRIFPNESGLDREIASNITNDLLDLRNRIAHHEPIYHLNLPELHANLNRLLTAMCPATATYAQKSCTFTDVWANKPS